MTDSSDDSLLIVGTYTHSLPHVVARGRGLHLLGFNTKTGKITDGPVVETVRNPTYLAVSKDASRLYSVQELAEEDGSAIDVFALDAKGRKLTHLAKRDAQGGWPCHVGLDQDERRLFVSNYLTGSFVTYPLDAEGLPHEEGHKLQREGSSVNPDRQTGPHVHHGVPTPDGQHVLICDAGTDEVARHRLEGDTIAEEADLVLKSDPGTLPRHLAFLPDGSGFIVVHELGAKVDAYLYGADEIKRVSELSTLPADWSGPKSGATIRIHPSGRFAYTSNRGHDSIFGIDLGNGLDKMTPIGWWSTRGAAPRDFIIDPTGHFLIAANQDGHNLTVYRIDQDSGALEVVGEDFAVESPVCVAIVKTH